MAIPTQKELCEPILELLSDGKAHSAEDVRKYIRRRFQLSTAQRAQKTKSGAVRWSNRIQWAIRLLQESGLLVRPQYAHYQITEAGLKHLSEQVSSDESVTVEAAATMKPIESVFSVDDFDRMCRECDENFVVELSNAVRNMSIGNFERLLSRLLTALNYGGDDGVGLAIQPTTSDDISGIVYSRNEHGFDVMYVEFKRRSAEVVIDVDEVQRFVATMSGKSGINKGLFIATAKFTDAASNYAAAHDVNIVDGDAVVTTMIEHNIGVTTRSYVLKCLDSDFFGNG